VVFERKSDEKDEKSEKHNLAKPEPNGDVRKVSNTEDTESTEGHRGAIRYISFFSGFSCYLSVTKFDSFLPLGVFQTSLSRRTRRRRGAEKCG
jgi:hypothetical protein